TAALLHRSQTFASSASSSASAMMQHHQPAFSPATSMSASAGLRSFAPPSALTIPSPQVSPAASTAIASAARLPIASPGSRSSVQSSPGLIPAPSYSPLLSNSSFSVGSLTPTLAAASAGNYPTREE